MKELVFRLSMEAPARVRSLTLPDGRRFWLKRVEVLPLRMRLQKGNAAAAFEAERTGLRVLGEVGLPVAPIALDGPDFLVLSDVGRTLNLLLRQAPLEERLRAFRAAGLSLARLHRAGFVHGRPAIRDICWDGTQARFIDLERFSVARRGRLHQALDVVMFVQTVMTATNGSVPELDAALDAYVSAAPVEVMPMVRRVVRWLGWLRPLANAVLRLRPQSRELAAVPLTLARLR
ncbi:serine/threonine protein phosphatase [Tabrizicola sp.]|uniref:serine/threonine protein phosphatase n=1 Tax=Tabrizicola sp. TaxID=2005166 RepID=UPI00286AFDCE|nr:serine/threonine protein phosphatase [Tabrizicola sp.]